MDEYVTRTEYDEYKLRMQTEHEHMHKLIEALEESYRQQGELLVTIQRMSITQSAMLEEQKKQGERLAMLENRDGKMWRKVTEHVVTVTVGALLGYIFVQVGL